MSRKKKPAAASTPSSAVTPATPSLRQPPPTSSRTRRAASSLGGATSLGGRGSDRAFADLVGSQSAQKIEARKTRRESVSKAAQGDRKESRFEQTAAEKIQGHVSGKNKRAQSRRDSKNA